MNKKVESIILMIMCFILGMAVVVQIKTVNSNGTTISSNSKTGDLKTQVLRMKEKYERQYDELEELTKQLEDARQQATSNNGELEELEAKIKQDNLLLGNTNVKGTGITITLTDGKKDLVLIDSADLLIHAENVLAVVNELKNAGAEAISINGERVVNTSAISCDGNIIIVNGKKVSTPIEIAAIGYAPRLTTLSRAGGTLENFALNGKGVEIKKPNNIEMSKFTGVYNFKYLKTK